MKQIKKYISIILCFAMLFAMNVPALAADLSDLTDYESQIRLLDAIGVTEGVHFESQANNFVTRYELALLLTRLLNAEADGYSSNTVIGDVSEKQYPYVAYLYDLGILKGTADGTFAPNEYVTVNQATIAVMRVLGYDIAAELKGGSESAYWSIASKLGLDDGISLHRDDRIQLKYLVSMFYNALRTGMYEQTVFGTEVDYETNEERTLLYDKFDIEFTEGRVNAIDISNIEGTTADTGYVTIGNTKFAIGSTNAYDLFGYYVTAYYKDKGASNYELVLIDESEFCTSVSFAASELSYEEFCYTYTDENGRDKDLKLSDDFVLIVNDVFTTYSKGAMIPDAGFVTLVDIDDNNKYDTVIIENECIVIAHSYNNATDEIALKYPAPDGRRVISLEDIPEENIKIYNHKGAESSLSEIREWSVLTLQENDDYITIYVSNENIKGSVSQIETEGGITYITISDVVYELSVFYKDDRGTAPRLSDQGTFYMDRNGKIAAMRLGGSEWTYAISLDAESPEGLAQAYEFKLLSPASPTEPIVVSAARSIDVNGTECSSNGKNSSGTDMLSILVDAPQVIRYKSGASGLITDIETEGEGRFVLMDRAGGYDEATESWIPATKAGSLSSSTIQFYNNVFGQTYGLSADTALFTVAINSDNTINFDDEDNMEVIDTSYLINAQSYKIRAYAEDPNATTADVILVMNNIPINATNGSQGFVKKISTVLDVEGETVECMEVYKADGKTEKVLSETATYFSDLGITQNDIVLYRTFDGVATAVSLLYDIETETVVNNHVKFTAWYSSHIVMSAPIANIEGTLIEFGASKDSTGVYKPIIIMANEAKIVLCTVTGTGYTYKPGSFSNLKDINHFGESSKVVMYASENKPKFIYIYDID